MKKTIIFSIAAAVLLTVGLNPAFAKDGECTSDELEDQSQSNPESTSSASPTLLRCGARGAGDFSIDVKFSNRRGRTKFDTSFEAAPGLGFLASDVLDVLVGGQRVGQITLAERLNGDVEGDLNFDTTAQANDDDLPLPFDFPQVGSGTGVVVGPLGCDL